ncbi:MAG TPA: 50S ribosomal protein L15 [bacterium]|nr:50S ribosomal protein L15 [bacterium]
MQLHQLKPNHKRNKGKRIGRGGKRGTYSGRGIKGQKSRAGRQMMPSIRQFVKKYPKLRGYRFKIRGQKPAIVDLKLLEKNFKKGDLVSPSSLLEKKLISRIKGKVPKVKILSRGELKKELIIKNCQVSKSAKEKIEKAKGIIK